MDDNSVSHFTGDIPDFYDRGLGHAMFEGYAADIARRAAADNPLRLLETAAGTGIATRCLRDTLPASTELTATDLNVDMLSRARDKFAVGERVTFMSADAADLPFLSFSFDTVVCQFGVMFFPDKSRAYREVRRVLRGGGRYLFSVWDAHAHNSFARLAHEAVSQSYPSDPTAIFPGSIWLSPCRGDPGLVARGRVQRYRRIDRAAREPRSRIPHCLRGGSFMDLRSSNRFEVAPEWIPNVWLRR